MKYKISKRLIKIIKNDLSNFKHNFYPGGCPMNYKYSIDREKLCDYLKKLERASPTHYMNGTFDLLLRKRYIGFAVAYIAVYGNLHNEIKRYLITYANEDVYNEIISTVKRDESIEIYHEYKY